MCCALVFRLAACIEMQADVLAPATLHIESSSGHPTVVSGEVQSQLLQASKGWTEYLITPPGEGTYCAIELPILVSAKMEICQQLGWPLVSRLAQRKLLDQ